MQNRISFYFAVVAACIVGLLVVIYVTIRLDSERTGAEPVVTTTNYAEKTGRQCSRTLAYTATDVAVAVSCSYPPAESRIRDLLEGAGQ